MAPKVSIIGCSQVDNAMKTNINYEHIKNNPKIYFVNCIYISEALSNRGEVTGETTEHQTK